ncbi:type II secretion system protein [Effusibacillus consociatus]|uniref:Type II secretion system protein n=1 Tax=Effusibacillus consociatus TaxID=1117041 RepID=A0ABV9Q5M1_9BACL
MFKTKVQNEQGVKREEAVQQKCRKRQEGFTLIEMLAVVVILVIVAGVGYIMVNRQIESSRERADVANFRTIADAAMRYMMDNPNFTGNALTWQSAATSDLVPTYLPQQIDDPWNTGNDGGTADYTVAVDTANRRITITGQHVYTGNLPANTVGLTGGNNAVAVLTITY